MNRIVVQKFGGSSVENLDKLKIVSEQILKEYKEGNKVVVVVSAQGKTTDKLIQDELEITNNVNKREHDVLVSVGEQITIAKLAILLNSMGYNAISLTGWQIPILTDENNTNATIKNIDTTRILKLLNENYIVIVAGFQGIDINNNITTLGRGGSDTTAVALAAYLNADRCDIYTDVDGVFEKDPKKYPDAEKISEITYMEVLNKKLNVMDNTATSLCMNSNIPIIVFDINEKGNLKKVVEGQKIGTTVENKPEN